MGVSDARDTAAPRQDDYDEFARGYADFTGGADVDTAYGLIPGIEALNLMEGGTVLDYGSGNGRLAQVLRSMGGLKGPVKIVGVDISEEQVRLAQAAEAEGEAEGISASYHHIPGELDGVVPVIAQALRDGGADAVTCNWVLCHLDQSMIEGIMGVWASALKPGGKAVVVVNNWEEAIGNGPGRYTFPDTEIRVDEDTKVGDTGTLILRGPNISLTEHAHTDAAFRDMAATAGLRWRESIRRALDLGQHPGGPRHPNGEPMAPYVVHIFERPEA